MAASRWLAVVPGPVDSGVEYIPASAAGHQMCWAEPLVRAGAGHRAVAAAPDKVVRAAVGLVVDPEDYTAGAGRTDFVVA